MPSKIPDRWIPYKACGDVIECTRFICFKVPLNRNVQTGPEITQIWDVPAVLAEIPKLGAVIDLTNTARYYNPSDFVTAGVIHRKILMPGREIPSQKKVREFMDAVDEFLGKDCDSLIGVHCTHGLNRTGYMVCRYMRDRMGIPAEDAIKKFEKARGYEIEREIYIASLLDKKLPCPDFDTSESQRRDDNESRHRKYAQIRNSHENQPRANNGCQSRNVNDKRIKTTGSESENKVKTLSKSRKNKLRRRKRKLEYLAASQDSEIKPKKRKIYNYQ